jgi:hypothetical protein
MADPWEMIVAEIVSVEWQGIKKLGDGETNLLQDNQLDMGGGFRFFYGRNYPTDGRRSAHAPVHDTVQVRVEVTPNLGGIPIRLRVVDADDPSSPLAPIDDDTDPSRLADNRSSTKWPNTNQDFFNATTERNSRPQAQTALVTVNLKTCQNPGDNFRVIAGARNRGGENLVKPLLFEQAPETLGRLYFDADDNNLLEPPFEPILTELDPALGADNRFVTTPLLTIWRRLYVEVDSMGSPQFDNSYYGYGFGEPTPPNLPPDHPLQGFLDDPRPGDIPDPNITAFSDAFRPAFIEVVTDYKYYAQWNQRNLPFAPYLPHPKFRLNPADPRLLDWDPYFAVARQTWKPGSPQHWEDDNFWTVYVAGVYEIKPQNDPVRRDNDPNSEAAWLGQTDWAEPEYGMVPMEIIRDVATQWSWNQQQKDAFQRVVALHEIGHQFGLALPDHPPGFGDHVMQIHHSDPEEAHLPNSPTTFSDEDIAKIRCHGGGTGGIIPGQPNPRRP